MHHIGFIMNVHLVYLNKGLITDMYIYGMLIDLFA
jgi:hypothetical protein